MCITFNLCWTKHCKIALVKSTKCLNYLCHTLRDATATVKSIAYLCVVCPLIECGLLAFTNKDI